MAAAADIFDSSGKREVLRWAACFGFVMLVHGAAAVALIYESDRGEISDANPTVIMDFAALPTIDAPPREIAPGQEQVQTEAAPPPAEAKPEPMKEAEPVKEPVPVKVSEAKPQETQELKPAVEDPVPVPQLPQVQDAEVTLQTVIPPPKQEVTEKKEESEKKSEAVPTPPLATAPETTAPTSAAVRNAQLESWKIRLSTHMQRFKRYPPASAARGEQGTAELTFTVNREGNVVAARLQKGSGFALLDEESLAMIQRAQPLPRPPRDMSGNEFSFTVPVKFSNK